MSQLIPSLATLIAASRRRLPRPGLPDLPGPARRLDHCQGPRTISEVWLATGLAARRHHDTAYAVFHSAAWEWDDLGIVLATLILTHLVPGGVVWIAVDDTLCHKRGAKVAFGGIFLDAVLSSKKHKTLRFGLNWVVLGVAVPLPVPTRSLLLLARALAVLPQEGAERAIGAARNWLPRWPIAWRRACPSGRSGWSATRRTSTRS